MKKIYEYISFHIAVHASVMLIFFIVIYIISIREMFVLLLITCFAIFSIVTWIIMLKIYKKEKQCIDELYYVEAVVLPSTIKIIPFFKYARIISVDIIYYKPDTEETLLFKNSSVIMHDDVKLLRFLMGKKNKIPIRLGYNPNNPKEKIILFNDSLKRMYQNS